MKSTTRKRNFGSSAFGVTNLLKCVDNHELCFRVVIQKIVNLFLQSAADQTAHYGEMQIVRCIIGKAVKPVLDFFAYLPGKGTAHRIAWLEVPT